MSHNKDTKTPPLQDASAAFEQALQETDQEHYILRLYVAGMTPNSQRAIANVQNICQQHLQGRFELDIIDIYQQPIFAKEGQIVAAPTLVKELPTPLRKFIGDLSQTERILAGLDLRKKD
ncbi:circadian clock KaiB family protein [Methylobacter sp. S3L5C]|uniref:circadian clock KaiB family protein n=1 Tax=Methylobacter sp. S3L5C TaxID=2839024 RepID=UPI001FAE3BAC|nr:circadian clock KaiB family protein [Methylobacter sp. S3L5C]UOA08454.1 circadian clock KaiB family protein [Methylobacter sp. S3L5C]